MIKSTTKHIQHYAGLFGIFIFAILGFAVFSYDQAFQYALAFAVVVAYIVWGIVHHWLHKDLTASVVIEYVAIGILGLVVILGLISST